MKNYKLPVVESTWRHHNGSIYVVKHIANLHTERPKEYPITIVYQGINHKIWARSLVSWHRSFTEIK